MGRVRGWMLILLCCVAGVASGEEAPPDARLLEARTALEEAGALWGAGRYAEALERGARALALREAALGGVHPEVARCLDWLGSHHLLQGNPVRAEPLLRRALAIREATLGKNHPEVAQTLNTLGNLYRAKGTVARAEPLYRRALAIREAALGKHHPLVAESLDGLATLYSARSVDTRSEPLLLRALAIREAALGKDHPDVAQTLHNLASSYHHQGLYARAEPLYARALAIRQKALGDSHPLLAVALGNLAAFYEQQGLYARAEPLHARAIAIQESALGGNPPDVVGSLIQLAVLYGARGGYARAEPLLRRALALREAALGKSHSLVAQVLYDLADIYQDQGLYDRAEPLLRRALAIREATLGGNHPDVGWSLVKLGHLYVNQGLYGQAKPLYERVLSIAEATLGRDHYYVAWMLVGLGDLYVRQGLYGQAEPLYARALKSLEAGLGENHPSVARALMGLANVYQAQGLHHRAEPLLLRALALREAGYGKNHPDVAESLNRLAGLYSAQGLFGQAQQLHERALAIQEATHGRTHPSVAAALNQLAVVLLAQHRLDEALPLFSRAFTLSEQRLRQEALVFSESRLASFLQLLRTDEERLYALLRAHPEDARVRRLVLGAALLLKGRSIEESADISQAVYRDLGDQGRDTFDSLKGLRAQLAWLALQGPGSLPLPVYQRRLEALSEQAATLEADLARRSASLRTLAALPAPAEIVDRVAASLPEDTALIEFLAYRDRPLVLKPGAPRDERPGQLRYLALVLFPDATIRFQDLGPAEPIDLAASRLRDALASRDATFQASAQTLHRLAFQPLLPLLGDTRRLFLSTDGQLSLVPFAALHDGHQFLVEAFDFTYVPSGRNLLARVRESELADSVVVLADPDFGAVPLSASVQPAVQEGAVGLATRSVPDEYFSTLREGLRSRAWAPTPLPGTRQEAESIKRLLPQAQLFLGANATKERLLYQPPPGILHLATHGFFLEDAPPSPASRAVVHIGELGKDAPTPSPPDPLLRSGLVLAGASAPAASSAAPGSSSSERTGASAPAASVATPLAPPDSGLVTALELAGLNLWGTQLVVLSACDTGRGDVKPGQGVYGLHRAFLVAGAETVVMSLWQVNDDTTRTLMEAYYRHLLAGEGRAAALREAMREFRRKHPHPHYWAPFLVMGRETPLRFFASSPQVAPASSPD